jgi:hypothetical protein
MMSDISPRHAACRSKARSVSNSAATISRITSIRDLWMERYFQRKEATERCDEDRARQLQAGIDDQWISRFLANDLVCCDTAMEPFAREISYFAWLSTI